MKKTASIILSMLLAVTGISASAQGVVIKMKNGSVQTYPAAEVEYVEFNDDAVSQDFNILTEKYVPDLTFRNWIDTNLAGGSGVYTNAQAEAFNGYINLAGCKTLLSLKGLEFFTNATMLSIEGCTGVDVSTIPVLEKITYFNASYTGKSGFDVFNLFPNLEVLNISGDRFAGNMVIASDKLKQLHCSQNTSLTGIDVSGCPALEELVCSFCSLTSLSLGNAPVRQLYCHQNPDLGNVDFNNVRSTLTELNVSNTGITSLDLNGCEMLEELECQNNRFTETPNFNGCTKLSRLRCENSGIKELNVNNLVELKELHCYQNSISALDLSGLSKLQIVNAFTNNLETINVDGCTAMYQLGLYSNRLKRIDLTGCSQTTLTDFGCEDNPDLDQIKVWQSFDIENPPKSYFKPATARYVYEFTEEGGGDNPVDPDKEYVNITIDTNIPESVLSVEVNEEGQVTNWQNGFKIEKGKMLVIYTNNEKYKIEEISVNGEEQTYWGYWYNTITEDTAISFVAEERSKYTFTVDIDNPEAGTAYLNDKPLTLSAGINTINPYEGSDYFYFTVADGYTVESITCNGDNLGGSGTWYFPPIHQGDAIVIRTSKQ